MSQAAEVFAEPLGLQDRGGALVTELLVGLTETQVLELAGGEAFVGHRGLAQRGERVGTRAHDVVPHLVRCRSRSAR